MPIKPENKDKYHKDWKHIVARIRERAGNKCEWCGISNHLFVNSKTREICLKDEENAIRIVCTTAHLDHNPENCKDENLAFLCQKCHNTYDVPHRKQTRRNARLIGQLKFNI
jgi:hypothetical protein